MGTAMMDFVVREMAAVTEGEMAWIRFGTCGSMAADLPIGHLCVSLEAVMCRRNENAWTGSDAAPYVLSDKPIPGDEKLVSMLEQQLKQAVKSEDKVGRGLNCTADTFYSSQGRTSDTFDDRNADLISSIMGKFPAAKTLEMETFQLYHLAQCSKGKVHAAGACIVLANRVTNDFLDADRKHELERLGGQALLDTIIAYPLANTQQDGVWNKKK
jgi:uridine phosphorylase